METPAHKLVLDNLGLAGWAAKRRHIPGHDFADKKQIASIGLLYAAKTYRPEFGEFSTYAKRPMLWELDRVKYGWKPKVEAEQWSDDEGRDAGDLAASREPLPDQVAERRELVERSLSCMKPREREVVMRWANGKKSQEIAAEMGFSFRTAKNLRYRGIETAQQRMRAA